MGNTGQDASVLFGTGKEKDSMKIVIVGDGKVGSTLTELFCKEGHDVTVIDQDGGLLNSLQETYDVMAVEGNGACRTVLRDAGAERADLLIAATSGDEINLLSCLTGKKLGCGHTIARVRNPDYIDQSTFLKDELGLNMIINPEAAAANEIFRLLQFPSFLQRETFSRGRVEIVEIKVEKGCSIIGTKLSELYKNSKVKVLICAVERGNQVFIPSGDFTVLEGDRIHVTAEPQKLTALLRFLNIPALKIRDVVIIGGGKISYYLAKRLLHSGVDVKIIEKDYKRCQELSEKLPKALIIQGDGSQKKLVEEETSGKCDALVSLVNIDEINLVMSVFGRQLGIPKTIAKIDRTEYMSVFESLGVESMVSPKEIVCNDVLWYVRDMCNSKGSMLTLHQMVGGRVEALEFLAVKGTRNLDIPLRKLPLKKDLLLVSIVRGGKLIFPSGDDYIHLEDSVIVAAHSGNEISELNDIYL